MEELMAPEIDFVILADRAEAVNGRLYMMGGAFDRLFVPNFELPASFSIAIGVVVPWTGANEEHRVSVAIEHEDGRPIQEAMEFGLNVGRPPHAIRGQQFRATVAIQGVFKLLGPGGYCVSARIDGQEPRRAVFYALAQNLPPGFVQQPPT